MLEETKHSLNYNENEKSDRNWAVAIYLSTFSGYIFPLGSIILAVLYARHPCKLDTASARGKKKWEKVLNMVWVTGFEPTVAK